MGFSCCECGVELAEDELTATPEGAIYCENCFDTVKQDMAQE